MSLKERYTKQPLEFLVGVIESPGDFTDEARLTARDVIRERKLEPETVIKAARTVIQDRIRAYLADFDVINDTLELPKSVLLEEEDVKLLFRTAFTEWKNQNDDMTPDSWQYVLGAGFG